MEIEAAVEAIRDPAKVALGVLSEIEAVVSPAAAGLEIAENGVDPLEYGQLIGFARPDDGRLVDAADVGDAGETGQAVGDDGAGRGEVRPAQSAMAARVRPGNGV